jgi:general secretion pathway protein G
MLATLLERARKAREDESGFTLIELLIVIVILGILAGIVVFSVQGVTDRGTNAACKSDVKTLDVAAEAYYAQKGTYPTAWADLAGTFVHDTTAPADLGTITWSAAAAPTTTAAC